MVYQIIPIQCGHNFMHSASCVYKQTLKRSLIIKHGLIRTLEYLVQSCNIQKDEMFANQLQIPYVLGIIGNNLIS